MRLRFSVVGVFCNDISDHCAVFGVRNCKIPKSILCFIYKRFFFFKLMNNDIYNSDLGVVTCMADVNLAWDYFKSTFGHI